MEYSTVTAIAPVGWRERLKNIQIVRIELIAVLYALASGLLIVINTNLYIDKICRVNLNFSDSICDDLNHDDNEEQQNQVQTQVSLFSMYSQILSSVPIIIITITLGPEANRLGKKYILCIPLLGMALNQIIFILNTYFWEARAEYLLFGSCYSLFGGNTCFYLGLYSYTAATSRESARTSRISVLDASVAASVSVSVFSSAYVYTHLGYYGIYITSCSLYASAIILVLCWLPDHSHQPESMELSGERSRVSVLGLCSTLVRNREGRRRSSLLLMIVTMLVYVAMFSGDLTYLFTRKVLDWDEQTYTKLTSMWSTLSCLSSLMLLPLLSYMLEIPDTLLGWSACISALTGMLLTGLARDSTVMILGSVLSCLSPLASSVVRSQISKIVPKEELGDVYSVLGCLENLVPLAVSPLATLLYNSTLHTNPGILFFVRAGLSALAAFNFLLLHLLQRSDNGPLLLVEDEN